MSVKYTILKQAVKLLNIKKMSNKSADEIIAIKKKQNQKLVIPELYDPDIEYDRIIVDGFSVIRMTHHRKIKKALKFAKETGLDLYIPYYPLCEDYPLTKAYGMIGGRDSKKNVADKNDAGGVFT